MPDYQPFIIGNFTEGIYSGTEPWLTSDQAWQRMENARVYRGRVQKRTGYSLFGYLAVKVEDEQVDVGDGGVLYSSIFALGGDIFDEGPNMGRSRIPYYTVTFKTLDTLDVPMTIVATPQSDGTVAWSGDVDPAPPDPHTLTSGVWYEPPTRGFGWPIDGGWTITWVRNVKNLEPILVDYWYLPLRPVMGVKEYVDDGNVRHLVAWDTRRMWKWDSGDEVFKDVSAVGSADTFTGDDDDYFSSEFWLTDLALVNNADPPYIYNPASGLRLMDTDLSVPGGPGQDIDTALMLATFSGRLHFIRPSESGSVRTQRDRFTEPQSYFFDSEGHVTLPQAKGVATHARVFGHRLLWLFERDAYTLDAGEDFREPFLPLRLRGATLGCTAPFSPVEIGDRIVAQGPESLIITDGRLSEKFKVLVDPHFISRIEPSLSTYSYGLAVPQYRETWMTLVQKGDTHPNRVLAINRDSESSYEFLFPFHCLGTWQSTEELTWDAVDESWDELEIAWDDVSLAAGFPLTLAGDRLGRVWQSPSSSYADAARGPHGGVAGVDASEQPPTPIPVLLDGVLLNPYVKRGQVWAKARLGAVSIYGHASEGLELTLDVYRDDELSPYFTTTLDMSPEPSLIGDKVVRRVPVFQTALFHRFVIRESSVKRMAIDAIVAEFQPESDVRTMG